MHLLPGGLDSIDVATHGGSQLGVFGFHGLGELLFILGHFGEFLVGLFHGFLGLSLEVRLGEILVENLLRLGFLVLLLDGLSSGSDNWGGFWLSGED